MPRIGAWLLAAVCGAAVGVVVPVTSASAAACPAGTGVTVVVQSGSSPDIRCDANGGGSAADNLRDVGFALTQVKTQPGFLCQIDGFPSSSCNQTPPATAYWGVFDSNGTSGAWKYSSYGVGSLTIPAGGWLGLRFQNSSAETRPSVTPKTAGGSSSGSGGSKGGGGGGGTGGSGSGSNGNTLAPTPGATAGTPGASATPGAPKAEKGKTSGTPTPTGAAEGAPDSRFAPAAATQPASSSSSLIWVAAAIGLLLALGMGWVIWQRRAARP